MCPDVDLSCDKFKTDEPSLIRIFWMCPSLEKYWREVFQTLLQILNCELQPSPLDALFGTIGELDALLTPVN